jgi:hypothetical protein
MAVIQLCPYSASVVFLTFAIIQAYVRQPAKLFGPEMRWLYTRRDRRIAGCEHRKKNWKADLLDIKSLNGPSSTKLSPRTLRNSYSVFALHSAVCLHHNAEQAASSSRKAHPASSMRLPCHLGHQWSYDTWVQGWLCRQHYTEDHADHDSDSTRPSIVGFVCEPPSYHSCIHAHSLPGVGEETIRIQMGMCE